MGRSVRRGFAALSLLCLVGAACGQGEQRDESDQAAREDYIEQAGAICDSSNEEFNALFESDFPTIRSRSDEFFAKAAPLIEDRMSELRELEIPEGDEEEINSMLDSGDKAVEDFERAAQDEELAADLFSQEGGENSLAFEDKAGEYGIEQCATDEGGDEEETPAAKVDTSGFSAEKKAYIEQVDAICTSTEEKLAPIEETVFAEFPPTAEGWKEGLPQLVPVLRTAITDIRAVTPPAADRPAIESILLKEDTLLQRLDEARAAADAGDENGLHEALKPAFPLFEEVDEAYRNFGFQVCGALDEEEEGEEG
jgi:hypothetical protein